MQVAASKAIGRITAESHHAKTKTSHHAKRRQPTSLRSEVRFRPSPSTRLSYHRATSSTTSHAWLRSAVGLKRRKQNEGTRRLLEEIARQRIGVRPPQIDPRLRAAPSAVAGNAMSLS